MKNTKIKYATAFISSTFADMKGERDLIMYNVFPKVKRWAFERGIIFDIVDLRWGINEDQAQNLHHTIKICLERIKECDPLFVCMLGDRYGWIPNDKDFNQSMFARDISKYEGASATELEIFQALENAFYDGTEKSCIFLFRNELCFDGINDSVQKIFKDEENHTKQEKLKKKIEERSPITNYSAEFEKNDDDIALGKFKASNLPLEELLTEKIISVLREKYNICDDEELITDDLLVHQQFYHKYLSLVPKIDWCVNKMHDYLKEVPQGGLYPILLNSKHSLEHQVAHFINEEQENTRVIYRFMGIDNRIVNEKDLVNSIAYEISGDAEYLNDLIKSSLFLKDWFEKTNEKVTLIIAGIDEKEFVGYMTVLSAFKLNKTLLFINASQPYSNRYIEYTKEDFKLLAQKLLYNKAKTLLPKQIDDVLEFVNGDYNLLKTTINYLCSFANFESVGNMISELKTHNENSLVKKFVEKMIEVQNNHFISGIMELVLELLCYTPLPITRNDIVETISLYCHKENIPIEKIEKEVDFSLCFAKDFIEEYNARFIIKNKTLKNIFGVYLTEISNTSALIVYLESVYFSRIISKNGQLERIDGENYCKIIKAGLLKNARKTFRNFVLSEVESFYRFAKAIGKRELIELFQALAIQEMGHSTRYLLSDDESLPSAQNLKIKQATAITTEKIFAASRKNGEENIFSTYYTMMLSITNKDLISQESFKKFLSKHLKKDKQPCHKLQLSKDLVITSSNCELFTIFNAHKNTYQTYFGVCNNGFFFVIDAFTGETVRAFALPFKEGAPISTFYSNHQMHVLFEKGVVAIINLDVNTVQIHRFEDEHLKITAFNNYYFKGYNVMVQDLQHVKLLKGLNSQFGMKFNEQYKVESAFLTFNDLNELNKLIVVAHDIKGQCMFLLVDPYAQKIIDSLTLYEGAVSFAQDHKNGAIYMANKKGENFVVWVTDDNTLALDETQMKCIHVNNGKGLTSNKGVGIFYNQEFITKETGAILASFGTRKGVGFVTEEKILYFIDNGY